MGAIRMQKVFAHRGASGYAPENTLEAFELAVRMGADGVELDVHMTRDGELVVAHDEALSRVSNGLGFIRDKTVAELKRLRFNKTHPEYPNATIPTLREVYELLKPTGLEVNTELKTSRIRYEHIEEKCVKLASETGMTDRVLYSSFNSASLLLIKHMEPHARVGLLRTPIGKLNNRKVVDPWSLTHLVGIDAIHPHFSELLLYREADKAHARGMQVNVWTVNDEADIRQSLEAGADMLIGDYPDRMLRIREESNI